MNPRLLLEHAERLVDTGSGRPRQADLRRAVSAAYYALFHLLTQDGAKRVGTSSALQLLLTRAYNHGEMKEVSKVIAAGKLAQGKLADRLKLLVTAIPTDLQLVARAFIDLHTDRERADYDFHSDSGFDRLETRTRVRQARQAFEAWDRVRADPAAEVYLVTMLLHQKLGR